MFQFIRLFLVRNEWPSGIQTRAKEQQLSRAQHICKWARICTDARDQPIDVVVMTDMSVVIDDNVRRIKCAIIKFVAVKAFVTHFANCFFFLLLFCK